MSSEGKQRTNHSERTGASRSIPPHRSQNHRKSVVATSPARERRRGRLTPQGTSASFGNEGQAVLAFDIPAMPA